MGITLAHDAWTSWIVLRLTGDEDAAAGLAGGAASFEAPARAGALSDELPSALRPEALGRAASAAGAPGGRGAAGEGALGDVEVA
jgi:hypothetical protein